MKWTSGRRRGTASRYVWDIKSTSLFLLSSMSLPYPALTHSIPHLVPTSSLSQTPSLQVLETTAPAELILQHTQQETKRRQHSLLTESPGTHPCLASHSSPITCSQAHSETKVCCFFLTSSPTKINSRRAPDCPGRDKATEIDAVTPAFVLFIME